MPVDVNLGRYILKPFTVASFGNQDVNSAPATIDGITMAQDDTVFLFGQSTGSENGGWIYNGAGNAMTRRGDLQVGAVLKSGTVVSVLVGNIRSQVQYQMYATSDGTSDITIGTTAFSVRFVNQDKIDGGAIVANSVDSQAAATLLTRGINYVSAAGNNYTIKTTLYSAYSNIRVVNFSLYTIKLYPSTGGVFRESGTSIGVNNPVFVYPYESLYLVGVGDAGSGEEWRIYRDASQTITSGVKHVAPSEDTIYNAIRTTAATGTVIDFTKPKVFGTVASPETGNVTDDLTGALTGVIQKIYHNHSGAPTFPAGWVKLSGTYTTGSLNIIYAEWVSGTRVEYWIITI